MYSFKPQPICFIVVYPDAFGFRAYSENGSSAQGGCLNYTWFGDNTGIRCSEPTSTVLFDGDWSLPDDLTTNTWANQFLSLHESNPWMIFDFTTIQGYAGLGRIEVVTFICPEWGVGVEGIDIYGVRRGSSANVLIESTAGSFLDTATYCNGFSGICFGVSPGNGEFPLLNFEFNFGNFQWMYLAEVIFYDLGGHCRPDTVVTPPTTSKLCSEWVVLAEISTTSLA
jgi:hypothetical protein